MNKKGRNAGRTSGSGGAGNGAPVNGRFFM